MQPYSVEQSIIEGELEVKELFEYAQNNMMLILKYMKWKKIYLRE